MLAAWVVACAGGGDRAPGSPGLPGGDDGADGGSTGDGGGVDGGDMGASGEGGDSSAAGSADGGCTENMWWFDGDGDGYGSDGAPLMACEAPPGYAPLGGDCNDGDPQVNPGLDELCDDKDNDCDGVVDEPSPMNTECRGCDLVLLGGVGYAICPDDETWQDARDNCEDDFDAALVEIGSEDENDDLVDLVSDYSEERWWIGLNDLDEEGTFVWLDGDEPGFTDWQDTQPDDSDGEDCAELTGHFDFRWNDYKCHEPHGYICEF